MSHIISLISEPVAAAVTPAVVEAVRAAFPVAGETAWLERHVAADLPFTPADASALPDLAALARAAVGDAPVDINIVSANNRRKRLLLADMDSTMIGQECLDELAAFVGRKAEVAAITERAMRGEIAFEPALRERVALLRDLRIDVVEQLLEQGITLTPGGPALVRTMRAHGAHTALVSGGFTVFTGPIAAKIGFQEHRGNLLEQVRGHFTGTVAEPILGREAKLAALVDLRGTLGLAPSETMAVGDGANDLAMLQEAGLGVAFHAKPAVSAAAHARVDHGDLTALLYLQGYRRDEFVI